MSTFGDISPAQTESLPPLQPEEVLERRTRLDALLEARGLDGAVLFYGHAVAYLTGFLFVPTERPVAVVHGRGGPTVLVVPALEESHAAGAAFVDRFATYDEFPGKEHPMQVVASVLRELSLDQPRMRLGVDHDGYPPLFGYWGPPLTELVPVRVSQVARAMDTLMFVKSAWEIRMLEESSRWAIRAHQLLQRYTREGANETAVSQRASAEATVELVESVAGYQSGSMTSGARAGYRGQIGRRGALPHTMGRNLTFQAGDTLVTGATAPMWGYVSELERTMFMGEPSAEQRRLFDHMLNLQDICLEAIRPGVAASHVDEAMRSYFETQELWPHWRHHVGHGIGLRYHEAPFLDRGDPTRLEPGMVLTVEPGLYDPAWGGFRHSDTVVVTASGNRLLTGAYPRDLEALTLPV